ncbi:FUSC family protein [Microbacterium sp. UFMG61]|uniref:FUSC family protein n=1 Tax=Microbacterium sp. UFMG61 TaxID=2745935 RepID=UPI00188EAD96|nr:FUSC family protein [Microbacterium sp. UFMG61]
MSASRIARALVDFAPVSGAWVPATQAAIAIAGPPAVFAALGQLRLGLLASFGALIVLYLSGKSRRERAAKLPVIAVGFLVGTVIGISTGSSLPTSLLAMSIVAVVFSYVSLTFSVGPPGAIFPVLTAGSMGQLTAPVSMGGGGVDPLLVISVVALGVVTGYVVIVAPLALTRVRADDAKLPHDYRWTYSWEPDSARIFARLTVAVVLAVLVSAWLGLHHVGWVLLAVIGILQKDSDLHLGTLRMAQRIIGTALGVCIALVFMLWMPEGFALVAVVGGLVFGFVFFLRSNLMFALMVVTPMALLLVAGGSRPLLEASIGTRIIDTVVGGAVAGVVLCTVAVSRRWKLSGDRRPNVKKGV